MSVANKLLQAAAGNAGADPVYVDDVFSCFLYVGDDGTSRTITNGIDLSGEGGLVWTKKRNQAATPAWHDTERGATKMLQSHNSTAEQTVTTGVTSFSSTGYVVGSGLDYNTDGHDYVSWTFRKQKKFFDIVTYTGDGTNDQAISHNLGSVPGMIVVKRRDASDSWYVYHRSVGIGNYLRLNTDRAIVTSADKFDVAPTSTEFYVGYDSGFNNDGGTFVAYLFAHDEQDFGEDSDESIIYCGTYEGNGGTQEITLGWEPQWIISKNADDAANNWVIMDIMRGAAVEGDTALLKANENDAESVGTNPTKWYPTPTGFKVKQGGNGANDPNENGETYIYVAIRRPNKPASEFAATDLFAIDTKGGTSPTPPSFVSDFPIDLAFNKNVSSTGTGAVAARLIHNKRLYWAGTSAEATSTDIGAFDYQNGYRNSTSVASSAYSWMWRRAKGYFDVVAYEGNGTSGRTINHNLGVAPEMIIVKARSRTSDWVVNLYNAMSDTKSATLNTNNAAGDGTNLFTSDYPTATGFKVSANVAVNSSGDDYIAFLFASVDGISKIGTFSRTSGNVTNVDCGFSNGARLVIIKRTNTSGSWVMWDSDRGIVAGNDPYILLNSNNAQITNQDYIDPLSSGFSIQGGIATGDWVFYAIA